MASPDHRLSPGLVEPAPPDPALDLTFSSDDLFALRSAVGAHGSALGLDEQQVADLVLVAHELASNAVRHGGATPAAPGRLLLWREGDHVVCRVSDHGPGLADPDNAGRHEVPVSASNGRGLWITRKVARRVAIDSTPTGTTITAALPADHP
jgi:anti-sigma regulatory factor (Ser/Thr protein kinase)